jgi:hypothetical protein
MQRHRLQLRKADAREIEGMMYDDAITEQSLGKIVCPHSYQLLPH